LAITTLSTIVSAEYITNMMLPVAVDMSKDKVPNIRFNVCKTLQALGQILDSNTVQTTIIPALFNLLEDKDRDVRYYASVALQTFNV